MATNKKESQGGSMGSMGNDQDREFEGQGQDKGYGKSETGQQAGRGGQGSQGNMEDEDMNTAGGRQGQFSDSEGGREGQWSPGSTQSSDQ